MKAHSTCTGFVIFLLLLLGGMYAGAESSARTLKKNSDKSSSLSPMSDREKNYIRRAEEIMLSKSQKNVVFKVLQAMEDGCLCIEGVYDEEDEEIYFTGSVFFWIDATSRYTADDETFLKDLYWCGTYSYTTVKDMPKTVHRYSSDRALAVSLVRINFDLFDEEDEEDADDDSEEDDLEITGSGTGFFVTENGYLLTCRHVVEDAGAVAVLLPDEQVHAAKIIHTDKEKDLALLKVDGTFTPVTIGIPDEVQPGKTVFALGYPNPEIQGFAPKVTMGIISALTGMHDDENNYQIDAAVQPGNSGGPLFFTSGEVVGVISARVNDGYYAEATGSIAQKINYAVKMEAVLSFLREEPAAFRRLKRGTSSASSQEEAVRKITRSLALVVTLK